MGDMSMKAESVLLDLPEACIAYILSCLPSPREVARAACVSKVFRQASQDELVWAKLLPHNYKELLSLLPNPKPTGKKDIFDYLCNPAYFADEKQAFWLDRGTGGLCLSQSARAITIIWSWNPQYWSWIPSENSIFSDVAHLRYVCWFESKGEIEFALPPGAYTFAWRIQLEDPCGWDHEPVHFSLWKNDGDVSECKCILDLRPEIAQQAVEDFNLPRISALENGWHEYEVGEFMVDEEEKTCVLKFTMMAIHLLYSKSGICMDGVVVRPSNLHSPSA